MKGGPFSDNLHRMHRARSDGGAGADHADEMMELDRMGYRNRHKPWFPNAGHPSPLTGKIVVTLMSVFALAMCWLGFDQMHGAMWIMWGIFAFYGVSGIVIVLFFPGMVE